MLTHSKDGKEWSEPQIITDTQTDDRDPKLFSFNGKLFCTFQSRWAAEDDPHRRTAPKVICSEDGFNWSQPFE